MEPADEEPQTNGGAPSPSPTAIVVALVVAALVAVMVGFGGGVNKSLTTAHTHVVATAAPQSQG